MYAIYDTKNNEECIAVFDRLKEVAKFFNTSVNCIATEITRQHRRGWRYLIKKIED